MAQCSEHHKKLVGGVGKCSVPMWNSGIPAGFCDEPAYGERTKDGLRRYDDYISFLACPKHGGPLENQIKAKILVTKESILHVDSTPDDEYPLRILRAYRKNRNVHWEVEGGIDSKIYDEINEHQKQRAKILDRAIVKLESENPPPSPPPPLPNANGGRQKI